MPHPPHSPSARPKTGVFESACPLDCPDSCTLSVEVQEGRVVKIDGDERNPLTGGLICGKVRSFARQLYSSERVLKPARRRGPKGSGEFEEISWDAALDLVARKLLETRDQHGGKAILPFCYGGSNGYLSQDSVDYRLFARLGASKLRRTVCAAAAGAAYTGLYGKMPGVALSDYRHAKLIIVWGCNPEVSGIHLLPEIRLARERGARLVVLDPRLTKLAAKADLHIPLRPGTDLPVAMSLIHWLFENGEADEGFMDQHTSGGAELRARASGWTPELAARVAGVTTESLVTLARWYAESSPAVIRCGWGLERNRNGGSASAAILALPAVAGKFGVRAGGFTMSQSGAWAYRAHLAAHAEWNAPREINMNRLGETLATQGEDAVRLLFVYNANPLATIPDQNKVRAGLEREDLFTVVHEQVQTDTARYADILLPAPTFLERTELRASYGALALNLATPVIEALGEARPNHRLFADLCQRTGLAEGGDPESAAELNRAILMGAEMDQMMRVAGALQDPGSAAPSCTRSPVSFVDVFPRTPDGKVHLVSEALDREAPAGLYGYRQLASEDEFPLTLITPAHGKLISSTFGQLHDDLAILDLSEEDASQRGITGGDSVRVWNTLGEMICRCRVSSRIRPGIVAIPKGLWLRHSENGATANALTPAALTDLGGGACFSDVRVEIAVL